MSTPLLSIRIDVDAWHGRQALGADASTPVDDFALAAAVASVANRLRAELAAAYPRARIAVVTQRGTHGARPTRVRLHPGRRASGNGGGDSERVHVAEHAEMLRGASIAAVKRGDAGRAAASFLNQAAAEADVRAWAPLAMGEAEQERYLAAE